MTVIRKRRNLGPHATSYTARSSWFPIAAATKTIQQSSHTYFSINPWLLKAVQFIWGICSLLQPPLQQTNPPSPLPWAHQKTTSQHSACVLVGWPPPGPCTLSSHRTNTLSCHGRWLLYSDQNLNKWKQKRLVRTYLHFRHLNCSNKTHQPADGERPPAWVSWSPACVECLAGIC